jgi:Domain of unknown function (DUF4190)/Protein of unknown function (DUF2510)
MASDAPPPPPPPTPPGWYPDPWRRAVRRYWDGRRWTGHIDTAVPAPALPRPQTSTNGWAIASLVLGILGGSLLAIVFGLVGRSQIKRSDGRQGGLGLATAGIVLGCVWLGLIATVVVLAVTGSFDRTNAQRFSGERKPVARVVDDVESGLDDNDGRRVCHALFTERWAALVSRGAGVSCVAFVDDVESGRRQAQLHVKSLAIAGDTATARIEEGGTHETWRFVRVAGRWRVDEIRK